VSQEESLLHVLQLGSQLISAAFAAASAAIRAALSALAFSTEAMASSFAFLAAATLSEINFSLFFSSRRALFLAKASAICYSLIFLSASTAAALSLN